MNRKTLSIITLTLAALAGGNAMAQNAGPVDSEQTPHLLHLPELPTGTISKDSNAWQVRGFTGAWSRAVLGAVQTGLPAQAAGLQRGDEVLRIVFER